MGRNPRKEENFWVHAWLRCDPFCQNRGDRGRPTTDLRPLKVLSGSAMIRMRDVSSTRHRGDENQDIQMKKVNR